MGKLAAARQTTQIIFRRKSMETVLDALKAMEKATSREIAARMAIEPRDALEMLKEQQETGTVTFLNGYWSLSGIAKAVKRETPKPEAPKESTVKIGEPQMLETIREHGPQTAEDLATLLGITSRKVTSTLAMATGKGRLTRVKRNGKYWYCLPEQDAAPESVHEPLPDTDNASTTDIASAATSDNAEAAPEPETQPVVESVPETQQDATSAIDDSTESDTLQETDKNAVVLAESHQDGLTLPTPKEISRVIRKLKSALHQAEQTRESIMAVKKHKKSLDRMAKLLQELQL
ncbi:DUF1627 domain-containing protein [Salmonella enterica]|nr:DUF1627 domain-containing protein [Salmonella enterica]